MIRAAEGTNRICARIDEHGQKHVLGLQEEATENSAAAKGLLEDLVRRGGLCCIYGFEGIPGFIRNRRKSANRALQPNHKTCGLFEVPEMQHSQMEAGR
jgi:transposase-like protein